MDDDKGAKGGGEKVDATHHREHTAKPQGIMEQWTVEGSRRVNNTTTAGGVRAYMGWGRGIKYHLSHRQHSATSAPGPRNHIASHHIVKSSIGEVKGCV